MQLHINTYGAYVHVKDEMFEVRLRDENKEIQKKHVSVHKVTAIWMCTGTSLSTDAIKLAMTFNVDIVFLEKTEIHSVACGTVKWEVPPKSGRHNWKPA